MEYLTKKRRQWIYAVALMVVPLLVAYDALEPDKAPLWLALAAAVLGVAAPATALANMTPDDNEYATADEPDLEVE